MPYDYPRQVAAALDVPVFRDASCSGVTNVHMISAQNGIPGGGNPPQFNMLTPTTDLVTLGIGNNDLRIAEAILGPCLSVLPININDACKKAVE